MGNKKIILLDSESAINPDWVECVSRTIAGQTQITLRGGKYMESLIINLPLDEVVKKLNGEL